MALRGAGILATHLVGNQKGLEGFYYAGLSRVHTNAPLPSLNDFYLVLLGGAFWAPYNMTPRLLAVDGRDMWTRRKEKKKGRELTLDLV